ncbi:RNA exonuclease 5 [Physeter macrocephalus]|uniref:RNA exonuclease 5 n=1 Tax=Physeter macrocephalus TaxID=9755 RepID=A0A2Y9FD96_PHYMC|nr:RNA exonuclease 5 [Physeter catodon]XP_028354316.1 RNA exonuclease 5 [Physeter catodon]XP_028354317.1 RNA exonuclease 5 [Physeter catodon]XP_028354318.1 RNA exonuclease 5 [Physeter catodon]|eukprot:XP_007120020.2 RNA exonuclease 5 isoform X1 [Physeter catodon]
MEPEKERTGRTPKKGRKRRRVPNKLVGASEVMRDRWDLEERQQPEAKKARLSTILFTENREITHGQLCELLKYAVLGKSSVPKPSWCQLFHQNHLNNVVVFILQGMSQLHFYRFYLEFGSLRKTFRHKFCLSPPSSDFLADIIGLQKKQIIGDLPKGMEGSLPSSSSEVSIILQNDPIIQKYGSKKVSLTRCLLTKEEMKIYHFPLQGFPDCENFVPTKCCGSITDNSPLFGLDCEMCLTSKGRELTRISLVAEGGFCVMDELVKPDNKIVDYLTSFSGITKKILNPVTTKLKDVQRQLKALLPPNAVLVGHSLDLDLRALKMIHPYVIDTSLLYVREQGRRFKLKFLAKVILGKDIQCPDRFGHDATEDARTTLELAQYFLKYGPKKIAELNLEALASHQELEAAGLEPRNTAEVVQQLNTSVLECLDSMGQKLLFLTQEADATELSSSKNCHTIKCLSNKEVLEQARVEIPLFTFSIVQFSFEPFPPNLSEEMSKRLRIKWMEMSTVYAGPFSKNCNLRALKRLFKSFGSVRSVTLILESHQPHLCIQYEVLEGAQLAIESLDGSLVEGTCIKVQRPVTELTLDCDTLVNELEQDSENRGTIYLSGVSETFKERLLQQSSLFLGLKAVILPKDLKNGKQKKYCFLRFKTFGSAQRALGILTGKNWKLKGRHALTPRHLHSWLRGSPESRPPGVRVIPPHSEQEALQLLKMDHPKIASWRWGRKIENLYHSLCSGTLCLILLPGTDSTHGSLSGLGLMGIKDEEESNTPNECL